MVASSVAGYSSEVELKATQTTSFVGIAYLKVVPDADVIDPRIAVVPNADATFTVKAKTSATAKPGLYTGSITINVCMDTNCANHLAGSPFKLPYEIEIFAKDGELLKYNLSALSPLQGAADWGTFQGNASHTGYVPVSLTPASFNARWRLTPPATIEASLDKLNHIATGNGRVYASLQQQFLSKGSRIAALSEHDGSTLWNRGFDDLAYPSSNAAAYVDGKVYLSAGQQDTTGFYALDAVTGAQLWSAPMSSQWENYHAPTVYKGNIYTNGGAYGGLYSFDATGARRYFAWLPQYSGWTPAVNDTGVFVLINGTLYILDPATGTQRAAIVDPEAGWGGYDLHGSPVIGDEALVFGVSRGFGVDYLQAFDTGTNPALRWHVKGVFPGNPAYVDGLLLAANAATGKLEVYRASDGALQWAWTAPAKDLALASSVLVTRNLVFVSSANKTYAIDRGTHEAVWTYPAGGELSISANGILYIQSAARLTAINLR